MIGPTGFFFLFCLLLASRDAITYRFLSDMTDPIAVLLIYCSLASIYGWIFKWYRTGSPDVLNEFRKLSADQRITFVKLGLATTAVYGSLIFGLLFSGAVMFSFVDYGLTPLLTIAMAILITKEQPDRRVFVGSGLSLVGIVIFFIYSSNVSWQLNFGLLLAALGAASTAISTAYQKKLMDTGLLAEVVLMFRFPIPAVVVAMVAMVMKPEIQIDDLPFLIPVSFFCFFLPLFFMCCGLAQSSVTRLSPFFFIVPVFTFILGPILVESEWNKLTDPLVVTGMIIVLAGFLLAEARGNAWGRMRQWLGVRT